jgi:hypothetical protein
MEFDNKHDDPPEGSNVPIDSCLTKLSTSEVLGNDSIMAKLETFSYQQPEAPVENPSQWFQGNSTTHSFRRVV